MATAAPNVTPAAVSQPVKPLEEYFLVQLFKRMTRALMLKEEIEARRPVKPLSEEINQQNRFCYFLVYPKVHRQRLKGAAFRDWAMKEVSAM